MVKTVLITGASSGLGRGLALEYASKYAQKPGSSAGAGDTLNLALVARRLDELENLKGEIEKVHKGIRVEVARLDVTDYDSVPRVLTDVSARFNAPLDVVVVNAGISNNARRIGVEGGFAHHKACIETNVIGAMAVVEAAVVEFKRTGRAGHIVGICSVAGYRGLPTASSYSASKAAFDAYLEALRAETYYSKISVTIINPGYIDTPINQKEKSRPYLVTVDKAMPVLLDHIDKKTQRAFLPWWPWAIVGPILPYVPTWVVARMAPKI
ncbi:hypothetical protein HK104_007657 [Borealophlyctis nickersoniae]|nr:hypothetical protein HK104_007657 [Borealophlyctis nickersoniae]